MGQKAIDLQDDVNPSILTASPVCKAFRQLQGLVYNKTSPEEIARQLNETMVHVAFALGMCAAQADQ